MIVKGGVWHLELRGVREGFLEKVITELSLGS